MRVKIPAQIRRMIHTDTEAESFYGLNICYIPKQGVDDHIGTPVGYGQIVCIDVRQLVLIVSAF